MTKITEQPGDSAKLPISCPHCGAVNTAAAASCHQCHGELPEGAADVLNPALASAETYMPLSRPPMRLTAGVLAAGAVVLATLAVLGNYVYEVLSYVDIPIESLPLSTAVNGGVKERRGPGDSGSIGRDAAAGNASAAKVDRSLASFAVPASTSEALSGDLARTPADSGRASRRAAAASPASEQELARAEPCTAANAAVGLCSRGLAPAAKAETAAAAGSTFDRPRVSVPRKSVERAQPRTAPCTEGVKALGLCTAESIQGRE